MLMYMMNSIIKSTSLGSNTLVLINQRLFMNTITLLSLTKIITLDTLLNIITCPSMFMTTMKTCIMTITIRIMKSITPLNITKCLIISSIIMNIQYMIILWSISMNHQDFMTFMNMKCIRLLIMILRIMSKSIIRTFLCELTMLITSTIDSGMSVIIQLCFIGQALTLRRKIITALNGSIHLN